MTEVCVWIDPDSTETVLDAEWDAAARFMPSTVFDEDQVPGQPGGRFRAARHDIREFQLPVWLTAASESDLRVLERSLVASMDPTRGMGRIRVTSPVGDQREIYCRYQRGLELAEKPGVSGPDSQYAPLVFRCWDPYWYATSPTVTTYQTGTTPTFFPFFPLRLTASEIGVDVTVVNTGDVETWPVVTIQGPGSGIYARNLTTGQTLTLAGLTLTTGQAAVSDHRPGYKTVTRNDGLNLFQSYVTSDSALWPLARGNNGIRLEMSGAAPGVSSLTLSYTLRYLSP